MQNNNVRTYFVTSLQYYNFNINSFVQILSVILGMKVSFSHGHFKGAVLSYLSLSCIVVALVFCFRVKYLAVNENIKFKYKYSIVIPATTHTRNIKSILGT